MNTNISRTNRLYAPGVSGHPPHLEFVHPYGGRLVESQIHVYIGTQRISVPSRGRHQKADNLCFGKAIAQGRLTCA